MSISIKIGVPSMVFDNCEPGQIIVQCPECEEYFAADAHGISIISLGKVPFVLCDKCNRDKSIEDICQ